MADLTPAPEREPQSSTAPNPLEPAKNSSGVALFMVIAAMSVLSILVTEFTYVAQINQKIAFDALDQVKAHYLAKSALKFSLLRLKAYLTVKGVVTGAIGGAGAPGGGSLPVPKGVLDKIWSFPMFYPLPTNIPGLSEFDKDNIQKFQEGSGLDGRFTANISSESARYNLNLILAPFVPTGSTGASGPTGPGGGANPNPNPNPTAGAPAPSGAAKFDPAMARKSLQDYLFQIFNSKIEGDDDFKEEYRDTNLEDIVDAIAAWADRTYERKASTGKEDIPMKRAPFYSLSELHMIPGIDDGLYDLFAPSLTVSTTPGINVNTMQDKTLKALVPQMTDDEIKEFFKFRDSTEEDNSFGKEDDFFKYLLNNVQSFRGDQEEMKRFRESLTKRNIRIVVDETEFKITVQATVNQTVKLLEAWVTLGTEKDSKKTGSTNPSTPPGGNPASNPAGAVDANGKKQKPDPGLRITFMRLL